MATVSATDLLSGLASFCVSGTRNESQDPNNPDNIGHRHASTVIHSQMQNLEAAINRIKSLKLPSL